MKTMTGWLMAGVLAATVTGRAQQDLKLADTLTEVTAEPWQLFVDALHYTILFEHDALQTRTDFESDKSEGWRDGSSDGQGWGLRLSIAKGDGAFSIRYIAADGDYVHTTDGGRQTIESSRNDLELLWNQQAGATEFALWGWNIGYRYLGVKKRMELVEGGDSLSFNDGVTYHMLTGGYFGQWQPFKGPNLGFYASINGLLGECSGIARVGSDLAWDGTIEENYDQEYSLGYGARIEAGLQWQLRNGIRFSASYHREWIHSFDATNSGIVVFPDNSDALFIETTHAVLLAVGYAF
jgi:hypothetical protein